MSDLATALKDVKKLVGQYRSLQTVEAALAELGNLEQVKRDLTAQQAKLKVEVDKARQSAQAARKEEADAKAALAITRKEIEEVEKAVFAKSEAILAQANEQAQKLIGDAKTEIAQKHEDAKQVIGALVRDAKDIEAGIDAKHIRLKELNAEIAEIKAKFQ